MLDLFKNQQVNTHPVEQGENNGGYLEKNCEISSGNMFIGHACFDVGLWKWWGFRVERNRQQKHFLHIPVK